jgi:curli biogenesis system outer membrane secretion channel CsgG
MNLKLALCALCLTTAAITSAETPASRPLVAIYEFRSGVSEIAARAATDMFVTALVRSGRFRVMERSRVSEGVLKEKQLHTGGVAAGDIGNTPLTGVRFLFEGTLSEASPSEYQHSSGVNLGGMEIGGGKNRDAIAIDVRVVDAGSGEVLDVVTVHRTVTATSSGVSGVGNLLSSVAAARGHPLPIVPDVHVQDQHRESVDAAVRSAIEEAVATLSQRFAQ